MTSAEKMRDGLIRYLDSEILPNMSKAQQWVLGGYAAMLMRNPRELIRKAKDSPMISILNVIDDECNVDVEAIYSAFVERMAEDFRMEIDPADVVKVFNMKLPGGLFDKVIILSKADFQTIYRLIKGG